MFNDSNLYTSQLKDIITSGIAQISTIKPSEWTEQNVVMGKPRPGPFRYNYTPYAREIIDCLAPDHPARKVAVMKGAQIGFSSGIIIPGIGWMIKNNPGNCYFMVGAPDLIPKAVEKLDLMIDGAGLRSYIKPQVQRNRANKSGDTNFKKDFSGGYVSIGSANNHKAIAQVDLQYIFLDDLDAMRGQSKESGSLIKLIEQRAAAYKDIYKMFLISTPLVKTTSLIEPAYLAGDQRNFFVECPCCHEPIVLKWSVPEGGGMTWELNSQGQLIESSVGYVCQQCAGFFNDKDKYNLLNGGMWKPTATPSEEGYYSYHIPSLYAPIGMFDWAKYVKNLIACNPPNQPRIETQYQVFVNTCLGEAYESSAEAPKANSIQKNIRPYDIGTLPEKLSINDGNGKIVLLTCAADMNGLVDDARLDYEIVAWTETGASYSVQHGSIGTFIPRENTRKHKVDREHWSYERNSPNSVWKEFDLLISQQYKTDTGRNMQIFVSGLDCGHYSNFAYAYIDATNSHVIGLKGKEADKYIKFGIDVPLFKPARERSKLYILEVGLIKDDLSDYMALKWSENDDSQPNYFMNFPQPSNGLYGFTNYFEHFESEHRVIDTNTEGAGIAARWIKKSSNVQNHMWDCRVYNIALREIVVSLIGKELKIKNFTWKEYVEIVTGEAA